MDILFLDRTERDAEDYFYSGGVMSTQTSQANGVGVQMTGNIPRVLCTQTV